LRAAGRIGVQKLFARRGVPISDLLEVISDLVAQAEEIKLQGEAPPCRDENDRMYLHCATQGSAKWLITRDHDLLDRAGDSDIGSVSIVTPEAFIEQALAEGVNLSA
jgi:predicted nucleic acid-binding protein